MTSTRSGPPRPAAAPHPLRTPLSTYRLQLGPSFPFDAARRVLPHLASLGVSHVHLSPVLEAVPGSEHGYDVTDHSRVREELGGEEGLRALAAGARAQGLGVVADLVPNHMAVPGDLRLNPRLWETLRDGPSSPSARWFDIDWEAGGGRMLLPVLPCPLGDALPRLRADGGMLRHADDPAPVLPLRPGTEGLPLPELLAEQYYRPAWWRLARTELTHRRFFTVSGLIGLRVEEPEVFDGVHATMLRLLHEDVVDGLRVDHPDGLADPGGYLHRLHRATGGRWTVVEKILAGGESLPADWPVAGTTGYDALHRVDGVFHDPAGHAELVALHARFTEADEHLGGAWEATARQSAREVVAHDLQAETERLTAAAVRVRDAAPALALRDLSSAALRSAVRALLVRMPVYRPYVTPGVPADAADTALLTETARRAAEDCRAPDEAEALVAVRDMALGRLGGGEAEQRFVRQFGQVSSAVRAKSLEDRAFYRFTPLLSACEVGGDPGRPAVAPADFHEWCLRALRDRPSAGTVLSTHDTKRSADVRAALAVLTERPERWARLVAAAGEGPDRHTVWTACQTAFGLAAAGPDGRVPDADRVAAAVLKALREAHSATSWTDPDTEYEEAVDRFVRGGTGPVPGARARAVAELARELAPYVRVNVLGAALLHLTMPGVPDVYQGTERLRASLVDPDNRRPVDFTAPPGAGLDAEKDHLTRTALRLRRSRPELFLGAPAGAGYLPLHCEGPAAAHCLAFLRTGEREDGEAPAQMVTAVTRLGARLADAGGWQDTVLPLPPGSWEDRLSGKEYPGGPVLLHRLFADGPAALLVHRGNG